MSFRYPAALAVAVLLSAALTTHASAHAHLKSATPAANGTVATSPAELDLVFSEAVNAKFSGVKLTGPDNKPVPTGEGKVGSGGSTLAVPVSASLPAGTYKVEWHALAADGHKTNGSYTFIVKP